MADIIRNIVTRIDSTVNWTTLNPVPANGEQCIEILPKGLFKLKVGDGKTPWIALKYATMNSYDPRIGDLDELITKDKSTIVYAINSVQEEVNLTEDDIARIKEVLKHVVPQYSVLPTASALTLGVVAQYIGETTEDYIHNCFYEVVSKTEVDPETGEIVTVYKWEKTDTTDISKKVDKTDESSKIYGTDEDGNQTTYDKEDFGKVDDVQLNGVSVVENKIANLEPEAEDVAYTNEQYPEMHTLQDAMDKLLYINPSISSFTSVVSGGTFEVGDRKEVNKFTFSTNKALKFFENIKISGISTIEIPEESKELKSYTYTLSQPKTVLADTTYTLSMKEKDTGNQPASKSISFTFQYRRYWGHSSKESLTETDVKSLSSGLASNRLQTQTITCNNEYIYFAIPSAWCLPGGVFNTKIGGFDNNDWICTPNQTITNQFGVSVICNIYRSQYKQGGELTVQVL